MNASRPLHALVGAVLAACAIHVARAQEVPDLLHDPLAVAALGDPAVGLDPACSDATPGNAPLSLSGAITLALCNNPRLKAEWAGIRVQASSVGEMRAAYLPRLTWSANRLFTRTHYPDGDLPDDRSQGTTRHANLNWRLFDSGAREANLASADLLLRSALASRDATLQKLMSTLVGAYFDALTAHAVQQARDRAAGLARATLDATLRREEHGVAAGIDVLQARAAWARAQLTLERARGDARKAVAVLAYTMGIPDGTTLTLPQTMEEAPEQEIRDLPHWLDEARSRHPVIVSARAQRDAARARITAARAEGLPSLDFSYSHDANGYPNQGLSSVRSRITTYGLVLSVPLFEGFARTYKVRGAQAQVDQNEANLQDMTLQVSMEVVKAHADAVTALANLQASAVLVEAAEAAVQSSTRRYDKRAADILELLSTQNTQADAHQERIRCLADWQSARLRLLAAAGVLHDTGSR